MDTAILSVVPFHHGFGMFTTLGYLICGFRVVLMYRFEEELFLRSLQDYKIQSALLVPTLFSFFAKSTLIDKYDLSNLHEIASGGAPLSKEVGEAVAKRFHLPGIRQGYGLTETTSAILITPEGDDKPGAVGKVVPFFEAKVVDLDTGKTLGVNQRGELCVRGPMIMSGYVNNPEATNALIDKDGWLHSGDIAYWDEDEHFFIVDRLKSLIKYKGYQVAPAELESILLQHPNIFDAGVAGLPDDDAGELPAAVVVLEHGKTMTEKEIVDYVASQVTTAKKLRGGVVFVDEVPKGLTGKLDARKIREILIKAKKASRSAKNIKKGPAPFYPLEDGTAGEQLHKAMKRYALVPGTIAFTDAHIEVDITYAEYFEMSVRLAEAMKRYGLNTNHRIVVCSENSLQFFMPVLGALFIGVAVAPANDIYNERELLNSMGISQPTVVFVSKKGLQKILNVQKKLPIIQKIIIMDSKTDYQGFQSMYTFVTSHLPPGFNEYDFVPESFDRDKTIALIMNSSGSTGLPKGVALPHRTACVRFSHARDPIFGNQIIPV
nr:GloSensor-10F protein [Cloning vector pGloSensor-10F]